MAQTTYAPQRTIRLFAWMGSWLLAGLAWIPTVGQARGMPATLGPSTLGTMGLSLGPFLGFWTLMMAAMMLPTLAPLLSRHLETARLRTPGVFLVARAGGVVLGYLLIWAAFGLPVYGLALAEGTLILKAPAIALEGGAIALVAVGCYQLTPLQAVCLASCHEHPDRRSVHVRLPAALLDMGVGVAHGIDCLGTCGGLMLLLVVVGLMNLAWMLAITLLVVLEKGWPYGQHLAVVVGLGLLLLGILAAGDPGLIPGGPRLAVP